MVKHFSTRVKFFAVTTGEKIMSKQQQWQIKWTIRCRGKWATAKKPVRDICTRCRWGYRLWLMWYLYTQYSNEKVGWETFMMCSSSDVIACLGVLEHECFFVQVTVPGHTFRGLPSAFAGRTARALCCNSATLRDWSLTTACPWEFKVETGRVPITATSYFYRIHTLLITTYIYCLLIQYQNCIEHQTLSLRLFY